MKCERCSDPKILFSPIPDIDKTVVYWSSHVLLQKPNGEIGLFHYACADVNAIDIYAMFVEYQNELMR